MSDGDLISGFVSNMATALLKTMMELTKYTNGEGDKAAALQALHEANAVLNDDGED